MRTAIVIPARYASSRLPAKLLLRTTGKYLIQHVYEQAAKSRNAEFVLVAADDPRIMAAVDSFGGNVVMTRGDHISGTDRIAEVAEDLSADVIVNLQGDEPEIEPEYLDLLPRLLMDSGAEVATLAVPIVEESQWRNPNCVKVVCDQHGNALYFSRSPIPHVRDGNPDFGKRPHRFLQHIGLYAYRREFLLRLTKLAPDPMEELEKLEQLRVLGQGGRIRVGIVSHAGRGIDTRADYEDFVRRYREGQVMKNAA
jgi:3-deoxy-manno-octulosonate cytidylyltransferase (CMP-KDO synthetase)